MKNPLAVPAEMQTADYWLHQIPNPTQLLMDQQTITRYNHNLRQSMPQAVYDLGEYPTSLPQALVKSWIKQLSGSQKPLYRSEQLLSEDYYAALNTKLNFCELDAPPVLRYGVTLKRTNIRTYPTDDLILADLKRPEFDEFQEAAINPAEPVIILHQSPEADWYYIQTGNYRGWVAASNLGTAISRSQWMKWVNCPTFALVTGNYFNIGPQNLHFEMGAKIPLAAHPKKTGHLSLMLPSLNTHHQLDYRIVDLPADERLQSKYLSYTPANILRQAFKMLGQPYDWGGRNGSVDCSSFIMDIFRCFGFTFPRNSSEQENLPGNAVVFESAASSAERPELIRRLQPGALLNLKGHVMLYLGEQNSTPYIIHALSSYGVNDPSGNTQKVYHLKVSVTGLDLLRASGTSLLDSLTSGKNIR